MNPHTKVSALMRLISNQRRYHSAHFSKRPSKTRIAIIPKMIGVNLKRSHSFVLQMLQVFHSRHLIHFGRFGFLLNSSKDFLDRELIEIPRGVGFCWSDESPFEMFRNTSFIASSLMLPASCSTLVAEQGAKLPEFPAEQLTVTFGGDGRNRTDVPDWLHASIQSNPSHPHFLLVDNRGIEPRIPACKAGVFPLALVAHLSYFSGWVRRIG